MESCTTSKDLHSIKLRHVSDISFRLLDSLDWGCQSHLSLSWVYIGPAPSSYLHFVDLLSNVVTVTSTMTTVLLVMPKYNLTEYNDEELP